MHDAAPLIQTPQPGRLAQGLAAVSILILASTAVVDRLWPAELPRLVGEERGEYAKAQRKKNWRDGSMARWISKDLVTRSRTRLSLAPWWSMAMLALGDTVRGDLVIGADGWLFLRRRVVMTEADLSDAPTLAVNMLLALRRRFSSHDSELRFLPVPRKAVACAAMLPDGIPSHEAFDQEIIARLASAGATTVDLLKAWRDLAPEASYLKLDTHWASGAQQAAARAVARQFPDLHGDLGAIQLVWEEAQGPAALLRFAGFYSGYPAWDRMAQETRRLVRFESEELSAQLRGRDYHGAVAIAGTSFSNEQPFFPLLVAELERPIEHASQSGASFIQPLNSLLGRRAPLDALPSVVLVEFPIHQAVLAYRGSAPVMNALGRVFCRLGLPGAEEPTFEAQSYDPGRNESRVNGARRISIPRSSILSSGDGVVQLRLESTSIEKTEWSVKIGALKVPVTLPPGGGVRYLPVIEGADWYGGATLTPKNGAARKDELLVRAVLGPGTSQPLGAQPAEASTAVEFDFDAVDVQAHDSLHIRWSAGSSQTDVIIEASGTTATGESAGHTWRFPKARGRAAVLSLGAFQDGSVHRVTCRGVSGRVQLAKRVVEH